MPSLSFLKTPGGTIQPWTPLLGLMCLDSPASRETKAPSSKRPTWHFPLTPSTFPDPHRLDTAGGAHGSFQFREKANVKYKIMVGELWGDTAQTGLLFFVILGIETAG